MTRRGWNGEYPRAMMAANQPAPAMSPPASTASLTTMAIMYGPKRLEFTYRADSVGDRGVIDQVFKNQDYVIGHWPQGKRLFDFHREQSAHRPSLIVDAGANIGAAALYFLSTFKDVFVFAIEPEVNNWTLLETNTAPYANKENFLGAIGSCDGEVILDTEGRQDWAFRTSSTAGQDLEGKKLVASISPRTILADPRFAGMTPLILKIDIEGFESNLFEGDTSWMRRFALVIIELHDWMMPFAGSSKNFLAAVAKYDFDFLYKAENIFLFNRELLHPAAAPK